MGPQSASMVKPGLAPLTFPLTRQPMGWAHASSCGWACADAFRHAASHSACGACGAFYPWSCSARWTLVASLCSTRRISLRHVLC